MGKVIIGIDPGLNGAIGIYAEGLMSEVHDMPTLEIVGRRMRSKRTGKMTNKKKNVYDIQRVRGILTEIKTRCSAGGHDLEVWLEKSQAMPDQGGVSNFNYGVGYGNLQATIQCCDIRWNEVHPTTWKKNIMRDQGKSKDAAIYRAKQLFPHINFFGPQGGKKDGRAEAMLIAYYGSFHTF